MCLSGLSFNPTNGCDHEFLLLGYASLVEERKWAQVHGLGAWKKLVLATLGRTILCGAVVPGSLHRRFAAVERAGARESGPLER